jgi:phosphoribosylanthranilate isomerase
MHRTRIKICGFTQPEEAYAAARLGVDAIGLVFYAPSPRAVDIPQAQAIVQALPPFVTTVGLFVDAEPTAVSRVQDAVALDILQFHGDEPPDYCAAFGRPYLKAIRMREGVDLAQAADDYRQAEALLLDAYEPGTPGGTGERFEWTRIPEELAPSIVLAGGLDAHNVIEAITSVRPYAVDVSGGVEASKGRKDFQKMAAFVAAVQAADVVDQ